MVDFEQVNVSWVTVALGSRSKSVPMVVWPFQPTLYHTQILGQSFDVLVIRKFLST